MKLQSFAVHNFRSVVDSGTITVSDITCLIGANQAGKSSILQSLASISMDFTYQDFDLTQLGGVSKRYLDNELKAEEIPMIEATFQFSPEELSYMKPTFTDIGDDNSISVTKYYDNCYRVRVKDTVYKFWSRTDLQSANARITSLLTEIQSGSAPHLGRAPNNQCQSQFQSSMNELKSLLTLERIRDVQDMPQSMLKIVEQFRQLALDEPFKEFMTPHLSHVVEFAKGLVLYHLFVSDMPRPVYFKTYDKLDDEALITELKTNAGKYKTFVNLLKLSGLKIDSLMNIKTEKQKQAYVEHASGYATNLLRKAWKGEELQVQFRFQGDKLMVFTKDSNALETLLPPSSGSEGFQWFLGFYINFGAATEAEYKNAILLLDDPGVFLHPKGHKDLLELFEQYLAKNVTTIYSTHLPFLVAKDKLERLRLVQKVSEGRSSVSEKFYATSDKDVLFPLRAAIGVTLGDSLFIGRATIIAEGPSDHILINGMMREFDKKGKQKFSQDVSVLGVQGADKTKEYAVLLEINGFSYLVLLDNDDKGRDMQEKLLKAGIPKEKIMLLPPVGEQRQSPSLDVEDLFSIGVYSKAFFNKYGALSKMDEVTVNKKFQDGNAKINNKAKEILKAANMELDKVAMANEILKVIADIDQIDDTTEKAFCILFASISKQIRLYAE